MTNFTSGDHVYFGNNEEQPNSTHKVFIFNQEPELSMTSPFGILKKS